MGREDESCVDTIELSSKFCESLSLSPYCIVSEWKQQERFVRCARMCKFRYGFWGGLLELVKIQNWTFLVLRCWHCLRRFARSLSDSNSIVGKDQGGSQTSEFFADKNRIYVKRERKKEVNIERRFSSLLFCRWKIANLLLALILCWLNHTHCKVFSSQFYWKRERKKKVWRIVQFQFRFIPFMHVEMRFLIEFSLLLFLLPVRELGKFHGECYALKESNRGLFHIITKSFREARFNHVKVDMVWDATMRVSPKRGTQAIREHSELRRIIPESFLKKIDELADHAWDYLRGYVEPREPLATICHGDYLRNNIAFQYDENVSWKSAFIRLQFNKLKFFCNTFFPPTVPARSRQSDDVRLPNAALLLADGRFVDISREFIGHRRSFDSFLVHFQGIPRGSHQSDDVQIEKNP